MASSDLLSVQRRAGNSAVLRLVRANAVRDTHTARVKESDRVSGPLPGLRPHEVLAASGAVQRNVGVELEESNWEVFADDDRHSNVKKGTPIVHRPFLQLQAEWADPQVSNLEIVTNPPGVLDSGEWRSMTQQIDLLINDLDMRTGKPPFHASEMHGGDPRYLVKPGGMNFSPFLQMTAGVPLASMTALFDNLRGAGAQRATAPAGSTLREIKTDIVADILPDREPSPELRGFITMIQSYLMEGQAQPRGILTATFPKGVVGVMARTDFSSMFMLLPAPEREAIQSNIGRWVATMLHSRELTDEEGDERLPVFAHVMDDPRTTAPARKLETTRGEWLRTMISTGQGGAEVKGRDLLTAEGKLAAPDTPAMGRMSAEEKRAHKLAHGVSETAVGKKSPLGAAPPGGYGQFVPSNVPSQQPLLTQFIHEMEELYEGLGALGGRTDTVQYARDTQPTKAVIVEIRQPPDGGWRGGMEKVYKAVDDAIRYPEGRQGQVRAPREARGKGGPVQQAKESTAEPRVKSRTKKGTVPRKRNQPKEFTNVMSPAQADLRATADRLCTTLTQLQAQAQTMAAFQRKAAEKSRQINAWPMIKSGKLFEPP